MEESLINPRFNEKKYYNRINAIFEYFEKWSPSYGGFFNLNIYITYLNLLVIRLLVKFFITFQLSSKVKPAAVFIQL